MKAIELAYKVLGINQPIRIINQANAANAAFLPPQGQNMLDIYKSKWLREKEAAMSA